MYDQTSIAIMVHSPVTAMDTCSKMEYTEIVFRQNPGLSIPHEDHST